MHHKEIEHRLQYYLRVLSIQLKRSDDDHLSPYGITSQQARVVGFISEKQKTGNNINQKDIETIMRIKGSSVTSLMQGLERKGFILRDTNNSDDRVKDLFLTPKSQALVKEFAEVFNETEKRIVQGMTEKEKETFLKLLMKASENFEPV